MNCTSWIEIDLSRLDANLARFRRLLTDSPAAHESTQRGLGLPGIVPLANPRADAASPRPALAIARSTRTSPQAVEMGRRQAGICAVVKADAYGLGALAIAQRLSVRGVDMFAVYGPDQAEQLAVLGLPQPLLVLMRMDELTRGHPLYHAAATGRLHLSIHDARQVASLARCAKSLGLVLPVHIYLDTGMSRAGVQPEEMAQVLAELTACGQLRLAGLYTHFASAESDAAFTRQQARGLERTLEDFKAHWPRDLVVHMANTCGTWRDRSYHRDMVRIGLGLYGYGLEQFEQGQEILAGVEDIRPIARWVSRIIHVQSVAAGAPVGYNSTCRLRRDSLLGLAPVGYADGYPLTLSNKSLVDLPQRRVAGKTASAPVLGRINMDQIVIDLTDVPGVGIDDLVVLASNDPASPCSLPRLARMAGSSCYEMLCRISPRVPRRHVAAMPEAS